VSGKLRGKREEGRGKRVRKTHFARRFRSLFPLPSSLFPLVLAGCSWFTDFKEQPKIDPWESPSITIPPRANPQGSVPITGSAAPEFMYSRVGSPAVFESMAGLRNPIPADSASVVRGRLQYQINCAVCHGAAGQGMVLVKYGIAALPLGAGTASSNYTDGYIFAIIRNGRGTMPSYPRIEDSERWDIVNYLRALQGKVAIAADSTHGRPGETGSWVPGASATAPTRPAPFVRPLGDMRATPPTGTLPPDTTSHGARGGAPAATIRPDTTRRARP
jgi:mono/diheme cytochrome c family protein